MSGSFLPNDNDRCNAKTGHYPANKDQASKLQYPCIKCSLTVTLERNSVETQGYNTIFSTYIQSIVGIIAKTRFLLSSEIKVRYPGLGLSLGLRLGLQSLGLVSDQCK